MATDTIDIPRRVNDLAYAKARLEQWARWCHGSTGGGVSLTGRLMQGIKGNVCPGWIDDMQARRGHDPDCPICHGTGRANMNETLRTRTMRCPICDQKGQFLGEPCFRCHGSTELTIVHVRVNPACIHGTRHAGGHVVQNACSAIDLLVCGWREQDRSYWMNRVTVAEYHHNGTQEMKSTRLRISRSYYCKTLAEAHRQVDALLRNAGL